MHRLSLHLWKASACLPLAASALGVAQSPALPADTTQARTGTWQFHHEHVLGTSLEITVRAASHAEAQAAEAAALATFDHDAALLSTWRTDSEVSRWAATRFEPVPVSAELFEVLATFDRWRTRTGGALDASVEAATRLWKNATAEGRVPSDRELAEATEAMQQPHWTLDAEHRTATRLTDVPLALASFTKSYVSSRAADAALKAGASGVMLNVGGDVIVRGDLMQLVTIANPRSAAENEHGTEHIVVRDHAVATSGSYRRGFDVAAAVKTDAPQYSHLIDPRSARPADHVLSSTVVARDAVTAGALATAFSILPVEGSRALAASVADVQYLLVLRDGSEVRSANWPQTMGLHPAGYAPVKAAAAGAWNTAFELSIDLTLPRIEDARYRRPYVAVWIEDADHFPVRTLALWTQNPRWLPDLKQWYRDDQIRSLAEGTDLSRTVSSATRPPGSYSLKWDGKDNEGKLVKPGKYTIVVEGAREHGGYDIQKHELDFTGKAQQATLPAAKELGAVTLDYHKR
jgi:thiamine biosynthesis lipoprotein ApbE